jgi:uncharacterized membrane protein YkvA (DUF1232 family)
MAARGPDPFPRERFVALLRRLPRYAQLAWRLGRDRRVPGARRAALIAGAAYLASPIDLVPGIIPVAGQLDDAAAILLALKLALAGLPALDRAESLAAASLRDADLDADLKTIGATYAWLGRQGARLAWRGTRALARAGGRLGGMLVDRLPGH